MAALAGPAAAAETIHCGQVIDHSLVAANDIGPCTGDGLIIRSGGIILDLGGHKVKGSNTTNKTAAQQVGINFDAATGSTVRNGEVFNFDAGVVVGRGGNNTVKAINAHDNIAHVLLTGGVNPKSPVDTPCDFGDGIVVEDSNGNHLVGNTVAHNGPFSGLALVNDSNSNEVRGNQAINQTVQNMLPPGIRNPPDPETAVTITNKALTANVATLTAAAVTFRVNDTVIVSGVGAPFDGTYVITAVTGTTFSYALVAANVVSAAATGSAVLQGDQNGPCGPFSATPTGEGRLNQDIGIRIEGPGADRNVVVGNQAVGNQLEGISIHGYVCFNGPLPPGAQRGLPNTGNLVKGNSAVKNGFADVANREFQDGIAVLSQGPLGTVTCSSYGNTIIGNSSTGNARDGIFVAATGDNSKPSNNTIKYNRVDNNGRDGIHLNGPFTVCPLGAPRNPTTGACLVPREDRNGANNNTLVSNNGNGNGNNLLPGGIGHDGFDGNKNCDNNSWLANLFGTVNQACVAANGGTGKVVGPPIP